MKLTDLTQDELSALFTLNVPAPLADLGMGTEAKGALLKLAASLPRARQSAERDVRSRLYLDPNPWHASRESIPALTTLRQGAWEDRWVRATFLRVRAIPVEHDVAPVGLVAKGRTWYVVWRDRDGNLNVDRASDIREATLLEETFERLPGFDLAAFWMAWACDYEASRWFFPVTLLAEDDVVPELRRDLGRHVLQTGATDPETRRVEVQMTFDHLEHARASLIAYGGAVEVLEPDALRFSIADFAQRIAGVYAEL